MWMLHPGKLTWNLKNHLFEKENHLNQTFIFWFPMLIFTGVVGLGKSAHLFATDSLLFLLLGCGLHLHPLKKYNMGCLQVAVLLIAIIP